MPPRRRIVPWTAKEFTVSGATFEHVTSDFKIKPTGKKKKGYGFQYTYRLETREDYNDFINHFDRKANDWADTHGDSDPDYLAFVRDADHF